MPPFPPQESEEEEEDDDDDDEEEQEKASSADSSSEEDDDDDEDEDEDDDGSDVSDLPPSGVHSRACKDKNGCTFVGVERARQRVWPPLPTRGYQQVRRRHSLP